VIEHRHETRGVGGIFFDDLGGADDAARERLFGFVTECAKARAGAVPVHDFARSSGAIGSG
jgi:coproporphyrinogen III oxidase